MDQKIFIVDTLKSLLAHLQVPYSEIVVENDERTNSLRYMVATPDSAILIGENGDRLMAINHLVKRIVEKQLATTELTFLVDVNGYQKRHIDDVRAKANMLAERARYFKSSVEMDPMSSYERMIVHAEFTTVPDIATESTGYGRDRRVIIRYTETKDVSSVPTI